MLEKGTNKQNRRTFGMIAIVDILKSLSGYSKVKDGQREREYINVIFSC